MYLRGGRQLGKGGLVLPECLRAWQAPSQGKRANSHAQGSVLQGSGPRFPPRHKTQSRGDCACPEFTRDAARSLAWSQEWRRLDHLQNDALVSHCHCDRLPQSQRLETTRIYYFTFLEVGSPKSFSLGYSQDVRPVSLLQTQGKTLFHACSSLKRPPELFGL